MGEIGNIPEDFLKKGMPEEDFRQMVQLGNRSIAIMRDIKEKESHIPRSQLEETAKEVVYKIFMEEYHYDIKDAVDIEAHIVSEYSADLRHDVKQGMKNREISRFKRENEEDTELLSDIQKRDIVNALTAGFSLDFQENIINSESDLLPPQILRDYMEFYDNSQKTHKVAPEQYTEDVPMEQVMFEGKNKITLVGDKYKVEAWSTSLLILIHEVLKGLFETIAQASLVGKDTPEQKTKQAFMLNEITDSFRAESKSLKHGSQLSKAFKEFFANLENKLIRDGKIYAKNPHLLIYILDQFYVLPAEQFLALSEKIFQDNEAEKPYEFFSDMYMQLLQAEKGEEEAPETDDFLNRAIGTTPTAKPVNTPLKFNLDNILDKISKGGVESLSKEEKEFLDSKKI